MPRFFARWVIFCAALVLLSLPGCGGCTRFWSSTPSDPAKEAAEKQKKEAEKPKPDFDPPRLATQPGDPMSVEQFAKPGHWTSATLEMKANNFDFVGELNGEMLNSSGQPVELERTPFRLSTSRPAALTKEQKKYLEMTVFMPPYVTQPQLGTRLRTRGGLGDVMVLLPEPLRRMPAYQYFFFVAARNPDRYTYLKHLYAISPPGDDAVMYYRVIAPVIDKRVPLPSNPLTWTSMAYLLWDDIEPVALSPDQQHALLTWLHWGGQLIISGPDTLDELKGSFLESYLPARSGGTLTIGADQLRSISVRWTLDDVIQGKRRPGIALTQKSPWAGVKLLPADGAAPIPSTGDLLIERRVGRGRIVVSAFRLHERDLLTWPGFDGFFNACLLRHPPRDFREGKLVDVQAHWADEDNGHELDPAYLTGVRYLARDVGFVQRRPSPEPSESANETYRFGLGPQSPVTDDEKDSNSLGMWSDFNPVSVAARESLRDAAGIEIPKPSFVIWAVAVYLAVLVPVNWSVFRLLGRVEWAWFAAPAIALAGTVVVTRMAHLDIGFTRSQREIAIVELQAGYPRAHVARFTALYSSLSSTYDVHFEDPSALAQPFSADVARVAGQGTSTVNYRRDDEVSLTGFPVSSNSTGMVHSEHLADLGGGIKLAGISPAQRVVNDTKLNLSGAAVVRRRDDGALQAAWLGDLAPSDSRELVFSSANNAPESWQLMLADAKNHLAHAESLQNIVDLLAKNTELRYGDMQLVAWTSDEIPGLRVEPAAAQREQTSLIVAHLAYGPLPTPRTDVNTRASRAAEAAARPESKATPAPELPWLQPTLPPAP